MNIEIEIYMNNIVKFFNSNPEDLLRLVPESKKSEFFDRIRERVISNFDKGEEISLTKSQLIQICVEMNGKQTNETELKNNAFISTIFGEICLN